MAKKSLSKSIVFQESLSIPERIKNFINNDRNNYQAVSRLLRSKKITNVITIARGTSDNVALFSSYLITKHFGLPVSSLPPSLITLEKSKINLANSIVIIISQSAKSKDLIECGKQVKKMGAISILISNNSQSPIIQHCDHFLYLNAGVELGIAATKTFVLSLIVIIKIIYKNIDDKIDKKMNLLSQRLIQDESNNWTISKINRKINTGLIISRGIGLPLAYEISLKFKELTQEFMMPYSSAEVFHGPRSLIDEKTKIFSLTMRDRSSGSIKDDLKKIKRLTPNNYEFSTKFNYKNNFYSSLSPVSYLDPIAIMSKFYPWIIKYAFLKGLDPDKPRYLKKVTDTF
jgi:glucosamine--fructose-6-phosphate aminotransferase (isomerizing)